MEHAHPAPVGPVSADARVRALCIVFIVSGVCGLIYESIWSHYIKLFVGHAAYAQTVVLIVFIGGMAIGAWLIGRYANRIRSPLIGYAIAEAVIGLISLVFHRLFVASTDWAYASLLPAACVPESPCAAQWIFASVLILPQSILLGTTFPLMTSGILRLAPSNPGSRIALFYFLNSIGAAGGVLLAGFVLIPALGLPGTLHTAGLMNLAVALAAYLAAKGGDGEALVASKGTRSDPADEALRRWLIVVAALTGLSSFVYEIIWIRMLSLVVGASTHSFELMLAAFILGLALGGLWVRKRIDAFRDLVVALAVVQVLMGIAAVATLALYDGMFDFMSWLFGALRRGDNGYVLFNVANHGLALLIMLPATFLAGMTFPLITTALLKGRDGERAIGFVYAANTLGSIVGVIIAVHFALPMLGIKGGLILGAAIDVALGIALMWTRTSAAGLRPIATWGLAGVLVLAIVGASAPVLPERMASGVYRMGRAKLDPNQEVVFHEDGKTATITMVRGPNHMSIATNGKPDASISGDPSKPVSDEVTMALTALVPLAYKPDARTAAVIGFGSGMTTATLLGSPNLTRVDTIEIEPQMVAGARLFGPLVEPAFTDPRSRIVIDDAKSYFARSTLRYDLILSEPSNPWVSGVASLFTQEFYARVKRQLTDGGIFVQWIQVYEFNDHLLATILRALATEFSDYTIYAANQGDLIILASTTALPRRPSADFERWAALRPMTERLRLDTLAEVESRHLVGRRAILPLLSAMGGGVNSDYYPIVDQAAPKARFAGEMAAGLMDAMTAPIPIAEMLLGGSIVPSDFVADPVAPSVRRTLLASARESIAFLATGTSSSAASTIPLPRDIGVLRAVVWECATLPPRVRLDEVMLDLAGVVNPMSSPERAATVWRSIREARCASRLTAAERTWLDLFDAVAARDAARMAAIATPLARQAGLTDQQRHYALTAAVTGHLAQGNSPEAQSLLRDVLAQLPAAIGRQAPLRLLVVLAHSGLSAQAALSR